MSWCRCSADNSDFLCPPDTCPDCHAAARFEADRDEVLDLLYPLVKMAEAIAIVASAGGDAERLLSPAARDWLGSLGVVSFWREDAPRLAHNALNKALAHEAPQLRSISSAQLLGSLPRMLATSPESWRASQGR